jgi:drug/metabolite transporter (DMT)-like permease
VLSIAGTLWIADVDRAATEEGMLSTLGKWVIIGSEFFYALGALRAKVLLNSISPLAFNGLQMFFASIGLFILSLIFEDWSSVSMTTTSVGAVLYLAVVASILASGIFYWLVKETNAVFPTTWTYVSPIIALGVGALFLGEAITSSDLVGGVLVLAGIVSPNLHVWRQMFSRLPGRVRS